MASEDAVIQMFIMFKETWPNRKTTSATASIYKLVLDDISDQELMNATLDCIETCQFFPTPAEIRKRVNVSDGLLSAEEAFELVMETDYTKDLPDAARRAVKNLGGIRFMKEQPHYVIRKNFLEAYKDFAEIEQRDRIRERNKRLLPGLKETVKLLGGKQE